MPSESSGFCQIRSECVRLCRRTIRCKGRWNIRNVRPICFMHLRITHSFCCYVFRCFSCNLTADLLHSSFFLLPHLHHSAQHKPNDPIITLGYYCCGVTWSSLQNADPIHSICEPPILTVAICSVVPLPASRHTGTFHFPFFSKSPQLCTT